jgi:hypothetical protein
MGLPVPAFCYAKVSVNGNYIGLFLAVESILEPFLKRNFSDATGNLFKSDGNTLKYTGSQKTDTTGLELKSTKKNADLSKLSKMLEALNKGSQIDKYLDVDQALRYIAVSTALVNFDSYQGSFAHNYYLYEQNGKFTILPWDLNMSFGGFGGDASKLFIDEPTQGSLVDRPLIAKLFENKEYLQTYHQYLKEIVTKYLSKSYLTKEISKTSSLISELVHTDPTAFYTFEEFKKNISLVDKEIEVVDIVKQQTPAETISKEIPQQPGAMKNTPMLLPLALSVAETITKQVKGELPSTNGGKGMESNQGGPGGMQPPDGARPPMDGMRTPPGGFEKQLVNGIKPPMDGTPPQMNGFGEAPKDGFSPQGTSTNSFWISVIAGLLVLVSIIGVFLVQKRKWLSI